MARNKRDLKDVLNIGVKVWGNVLAEASKPVPATTSTTSTSTIATTTTTEGLNMLPFIIGGVVGAIALLVIGIGLYFYCRKKKKMGGQKKTQGLNTSGTTINTGTATGTTATGTRTTATNTQARY